MKMKKHLVRSLAVLAIVVLGVALPACESMDDGYTSTSVYVGVGVPVYGGYYGPGWGGCCYGGGGYYGGVVVGPPIGGPRVGHY